MLPATDLLLIAGSSVAPLQIQMWDWRCVETVETA